MPCSPPAIIRYLEQEFGIADSTIVLSRDELRIASSIKRLLRQFETSNIEVLEEDEEIGVEKSDDYDEPELKLLWMFVSILD